ncbi:MAG: hypothetical protein HZB61_15210 [Nitrospirae bacterium]|nr:hypothetical protein [Nitrospirota bacterium]
MLKNILLLNLVMLIVLTPLASHGHQKVLTILYTGGLQGELEPCGCSPKTDFGGVARLAGYISENGKNLSPYVLIDSGNFSGDDTPQGRLKTGAMLKAFNMMKYDAVALMKKAKLSPDDFISPLLQKYKIPAVSKTRSIPVIRGTAGINIGSGPADYQKGKLNILLTDTPVSGLKDVKGWDVIITSSGEILDEPVKVDGAIVTAGYPKGKNLGVLALKIMDHTGKVSSFKHRWQPLGNDIKEDTAVRGILNDYDALVAKLFKESARPPQAQTTYLGVAKCAECHQPFVEGWKDTRHAGAFASLERVGKSEDPECIKCHVVGFGEEGGFYSFQTTPDLANVQCEVCHGPGKEHLKDFDKSLTPVTESACLRCHTKDNSPDFNYNVYREKIKH